ncbi:hypothetical protein CISIN_1g035321mg [Citrus sinensis]|uniref:Uncharacterized protein n=1 Tax=Citrus sinensis TaxID=2711 RepID=A0A067DJ68_CITSI|nr:hypothetical protein CISIN_1g035321mg [Citrus sinensis]
MGPLHEMLSSVNLVSPSSLIKFSCTPFQYLITWGLQKHFIWMTGQKVQMEKVCSLHPPAISCLLTPN